MSPATKALFATAVFSLAGIVSVVLVAPHNEFLVPHILFYAVLTLNSYFSVRFYSAIQPKSISQTLVDTLLVVVYLGLALSIGQPLSFALFALFVFIVATPKYALMRGVIPHDALLRRKILIDLSGVAFCALVVVCTLLGYSWESAWVLGVGFALANVYHLLIYPMYRL